MHHRVRVWFFMRTPHAASAVCTDRYIWAEVLDTGIQVMTASVIIAAYYKRKVTETLPAVVFASVVMFFLLGLTGRISHIVGAYVLCVAAADIVFALLLYRKGSLRESIACVFDPGIVVWVLLVLLLIPIYHHVRVFNWDDFHYWAIYPKNMFEVNGAPNGAFACTQYKDYMRGIQFAYFFVFKILGRFSEPAMFVVNNALIVTALMPFFEKKDMHMPRYVLSVAAGIILPYLCMFQMLHCLGVDCIMTVMFGYGLFAVYDEKKDLFRYIRIITVMTALTVTKTAGFVFAAVILAVFFIKERKKWIPAVSAAAPAGAFALWKLYCISKGNTTYLHEIFEKNVTGQTAFALPAYAKEVTADFVRSFFTFRLNGGIAGATPVVILIIFISVYLAAGRREKEDRLAFAVILAGMAVYLLTVLYTYLFVFVEWEALSLSSYDRYVSNYLGAMLYAAAIIAVKRQVLGEKKLAIVLALCLLTLNYPFIYTQLSPPAFAAAYAEDEAKKEAMEAQMGRLRSYGLAEGERVMLVVPNGDEDEKLYAQYGAVPLNTGFFDLTKDGADTDALLGKAQAENMSYVYLTEGCARGGFSHLEEGRPYMIKDGVLSE